jgi:D-inositol-3-phosphate glycosyltransferase
VGDVFNEYKSYSGVEKGGVVVLANVLGRIPMQMADSMIVFGPYGVDQATSRGMDPEKLTMIPPSGELDERFSPPEQKEPLRRKLDFPIDREIALYVGRLSKLKGIEFLAEVIKRVTTEYDMLFILVGEGSYYDTLADRFPESVVRLPGYVPHEAIHYYYRAADVYIHPSPYEGIPLVLLEALNCGVPVISRPAGDIEFLTPNIVETPPEMANKLVAGEWSNDWLNKEYFTEQYQSAALDSLVQSL